MSGPATRGTADRLVLGGGIVFVVGLLALGVALVVSAKGGHGPGALALVALLCPIGLAVSFAGLVVQSRRGDR